MLGARSLADAPVLVLANKQELEGAALLQEVAEHLGLGGAKIGSRAVVVQPGSAFTGQGISDGLKWLVDAMKQSPRYTHIAHKARRYAGS